MDIIAFYLPQFHPIPENDEWWGRGFTEWHNVTRAAPRFPGHHQPQLPADLGFYDLRTPETREAQADLARRHGVDAFCYHHYWFGGRQVLERPVHEVLRSGAPDFPFLLSWANESWTRTWDGSARSVLLRQTYGPEDDERHFDHVARFMADRRYYRVDGRPAFLVYRPDELPEPTRFVETWQRLARARGFADGLHLVAANGSGAPQEAERAWIGQGFDAVCDFQPRSTGFPKPKGRNAAFRLAKRLLPASAYQFAKRNVTVEKVISYSQVVDTYEALGWPGDYEKYPCVFPSWDNTARRRTPVVVQNLDPREFRRFLDAAAAKAPPGGGRPRLLFVNAWNEWAEGCHLEPDQRVGLGFLEALKTFCDSGQQSKRPIR